MTAATALEAKPADGLDHRDGCPKARIETFEVERPTSQRYPLGGRVQVTRCIDCGRDRNRDVKENRTDG